MIDSDKISAMISSSLDAMHKYPDAAGVESVKKIINKKVGFFERKSLLAFLLMNSCEPDSGASDCIRGKRQFPKGQNTERRQQSAQQTAPLPVQQLASQPQGDTVSLWCSISCYKKEDLEDFLSFLCSESGIERKKIEGFRSKGKFSYFNADRESAAKLVERFCSDNARNRVLYKNTLRVMVRYDHGKAAKNANKGNPAAD